MSATDPSPLTNMARAIRTGERSAEEIVRERLCRIDAAQSRLGAFISFDPERSLQRARKVDTDRAAGANLGPLAGVPVAVKDNMAATFGATTCGCRMLERYHSPYDAHVVERLESAGAIIVGKTNLDEFAMGSTTENSAFFPTRNPWDASRVAGGSSGGSVAAVAARLVPGALGSDTGGSVRLPASFCGVVGLKPTYGRVSRHGLVAYGSSLDQIGPIAADVRDAALLLSVIAGHDPRDSTSSSAPVSDYAAGLGRDVKGLRVGVSPEYLGEGLNDDVRAAVLEAVDGLRDAGAEIVSVAMPHLKYAVDCYYLVATAEASSNLARFDGVRYGRRSEGHGDLIELYERSRSGGLGAEVKRRIMLGTFALSSGYHDAFYLKALKVRTLIKNDFDEAFRKADVIASPVAPTTAYPLGEKIDDPLAMYLGDIYTTSANLAGLCAISVPAGFDRRGLPIGLQLMGPPFDEARLLSVAWAHQQSTDFHLRVPPETPRE